MITQTDLGWMSAVFDLKASFYRKNNSKRRTPQLVIQIRSKDPAVINRLCDLTGIKSDSRIRSGFNQRPCIEHCPGPHVYHTDILDMPHITVWSVTGIAASIVLYNLRSFLTHPDRSEVTQFMDEGLANATFTGQGSSKTKDVICRFQTLGWDLPPIILKNLSSLDIEGGKAKPTKLSCGHDRVTACLQPGARIWCEQCHRYQTVLRSRDGHRT